MSSREQLSEPTSLNSTESLRSQEREIQEECGLAIMCAQDGLPLDELAIMMLREGHDAVGDRGQGQGGMVAFAHDGYVLRNGDGKVAEAIPEAMLADFVDVGSVVQCHARWATYGGKNNMNRQPIISGASGKEFSLAINGNSLYIQNLEEKYGVRMEEGSSDTRFMGALLAKIQEETGHPIEYCLAQLMEDPEIRYSAFAGAIAEHDKLTVFRDEQGLRPLIHGTVDVGEKSYRMFASETIAFDRIGQKFPQAKVTVAGQILPGMIMTWRPNQADGSTGEYVVKEGNFEHLRECAFEQIYFMNPESCLPIEGLKPEFWPKVKDIRKILGKEIGKKNASILEEHEIDYVVPIPRSGVPAGEGFAEGCQEMGSTAKLLNLFERLGDTRTFIGGNNPKDTMHAVLQKLCINPEHLVDYPDLLNVPIGLIKPGDIPEGSKLWKLLNGSRLCTVDDSIIHGNSDEAVNGWLRSHAAIPDINVSSIPAVSRPCPFGADMKDKNYMLVNRKINGKIGDLAEMAAAINTNLLIYPTEADFLRAIRKAVGKIFHDVPADDPNLAEARARLNQFCTLCFSEGEIMSHTVFQRDILETAVGVRSVALL